MPLPIKSLPFYLSKDEFVAANAKPPRLARVLSFCAVGVVTGAAIALLGQGYSGEVVAGFFMFMGLYSTIAYRKAFRTHANHPDNEWAFSACRTVEFHSDFITVEMDNGYLSRVPWSIVTKAEVKQGSLAMSMGTAVGIVLPLRAIATSRDAAQLVGLLRLKGLIDTSTEKKMLNPKSLSE